MCGDRGIFRAAVFCWECTVETITDIMPQRRDNDRVNVFLDGKYAFSLQAISAANGWTRIITS